MKMSLKRFVPVLCTGLLIAGGCAKQQAVKADQPIAPSTTTQSAAPTQAKPAESKPAAAPTTALPDSNIKSEGLAQAQAAPSKAAAVSQALEKIYFDFDSDILSDTARKTLAANFDKLKAMGNVKVRVEGNCDERGSDDYNLALSERRAQAAVKYLTSLGIPASRLSFIGYGEEKPVDAAHTEDAWSKNRRDEFTISK
ncbi:OmpA family protein [Geomonas ferrireducens]|uniref:OmpA family protein n=1 Tax=Geomonas ferrireducens TaxID=2570227 RepID=UPI0010A782C2|nr:OmpA family protein [Geomonas ferrireducens]